jgi:hypothetical protein
MIPIPVVIWTAYNAVNCIFAASRPPASNKIGFALALGTSVISCGLLSAGALGVWLGVEIVHWALYIMLAIAAVAVRPPGHDSNDVSLIAISASIRLAGAMIVWLCL